MGQGFRHFGIDERCQIAQRLEAGKSIREIAADMDRAPSSVAREVKRNGGRKRYRASYATEQARARRWRGSRLARAPELQKQVLGLLALGSSPDEVAGRLKRESGRCVISHESIYRFIYAQIARSKDYSWRLYLPRQKSKRGWRGRKGGSSVETIQDRVSITLRPAEASDRSRPGDWEADLMLFATYGQVALVLHERVCKLTVVVRQPNKTAASAEQSILSLLAPLPPQLRRTITFDNGTEFARHHALREPLAIQTYFCDPHSPWQKGGVENAIGRLRRWLPRKTDLTTLSSDRFHQLSLLYNHIPRKCLGYQTPAEAFSQVLHFECDSTSPPARG
jgi:IS30 family transposase